MNICIATSSYPLNRNEIYHRFLEEIIELLHTQGHHITILTQDKRGEKETFLANVDVVWFPWKIHDAEALSNISLKNYKNLLSILSLVYNGVKHSRKLSAKKEIDLFICLWVIPSGLYIYLKNFVSPKTPYIVWALGSDIYAHKDNPLARFLLKRVIKNAKGVFADGFELCDIIHQLSGRECQFLPTVHAIQGMNGASHEKPVHASQGNEVAFLCVANLTYVKGIDILIRSFAVLRDKFGLVNFKCRIIGSGPMTQELANEVKENNLEDRVMLLGRITDDKQFAGYFNNADCVIIPSRSDSIPVVLSEAIQFGKPVVTTDAGDMEFIVKKYNLGVVAKKNDPADLADKIRQFIEKPFHLAEQDKKNVLDTLLFEKSNYKLLQAIH